MEVSCKAVLRSGSRFYAPKILGGIRSRAAVGGEGVKRLEDSLRLQEVAWERLRSDLMLTARVVKA